MPNVRGRSQSPRKGQHNKADIKKASRPSIARDDLSLAYGGKENNGPKGYKDSNKSTNVKARKTKMSKFKTPKR
jgi:hypothetical protein